MDSRKPSGIAESAQQSLIIVLPGCTNYSVRKWFPTEEHIERKGEVTLCLFVVVTGEYHSNYQ